MHLPGWQGSGSRFLAAIAAAVRVALCQDQAVVTLIGAQTDELLPRQKPANAPFVGKTATYPPSWPQGSNS